MTMGENMNELTTIDNDRIQLALGNPELLDNLLAEVKSNIDKHEQDIATAKGRKELASLAHKIARTKTSIDAIGKDMVWEIKEKVRVIDMARKTARDTLDAWKEDVRRPLTDWENAAKEAEEAIAKLQQIAQMHYLRDLEEIDTHAEAVEQCRASSWCNELANQVADACDAASATLAVARSAALKEKQEREELERLRKDEEDRIAAEEAARQKAEAAKREAEAAERARAEAEAAAKRATEEAERKAKAEAEAKAEEERMRAANEQHRKQIMNEAWADMVNAGIDRQQATMAIKAIADGCVRHIAMIF